jgi:hypothetical protein
MAMIARLAPLAAFALLSACAGADDAPSLAKRPFEKMPVASNDPLPPPPPLPIPETDIGVLQRIAAVVAKAEAGSQGFSTAINRARPVLARASGAAPQSEAWISGQMELSAVERAREPVQSALADIDQEYRSAISAGATELIDPIHAAMEKVEAMDASQAASLAAIKPR